MPRPPVIKPEGAEFEAWMAKEHPGVDYDKTYATMRLHIRDQWKEYQRQMALDKVRAVEYKDKWLTAKEFDKQTADNKLRTERYSTVKTFADKHKIKTKLNPDYKHGDQWGKYTSGKYLYEPVSPELVKKTKKSVLKGRGSWTGPIFEEEWQRRKDLGQKLIDESRKTPDKKKWIITQRDLNKALTKLTHPITGEKETGFSDKVLGKKRGNLYPELTGEDFHKDPAYLEKNPKSKKTEAVMNRIRKRILKKISGPQTERLLPAIKRSTPFSDIVHIMHTTYKGGEEYLTVDDLAVGSKKQNLTYATQGPDGLDRLRTEMQSFLNKLQANHGHKGIDGEVKLDPRTVKKWNLPKSTWNLGELADRFNLGLTDMAMATDGQVRGNLLELETMKMIKNPFKGNVGQVIAAGTLGDITVKELDESLGKLELQSVNPETGKTGNPVLKYNPDGSLKFKNKFYLRDEKGKLLTNPDGSTNWRLDPAKVTSTDADRIHSVLSAMEEALPTAAEGKPISLFSLAEKTKNPMFMDLINKTSEIPDLFEGPQAQKACSLLFPRVKNASGPGCGDQVRQALQQDSDGFLKKVSELPPQGGFMSRAKIAASNILNKIPKGGRLGAILAGAGAVGGGAYALLAGDEAKADTMKYNATTGEFDDAEGEPETQEGILNWIADNPIKSGLAPIPALLGASHFAPKAVKGALQSFPALVAPALAAEKLYQYKEGVDPISMATDPLNVIFAAGWETKASAAAKREFYKDPKNQRLFQMKNFKNPRNIPNALRSAVMSPRAGGTKLMWGLRAGKEATLAPSGLARLGGMALRATPIGWGIGALSAANYGWNKYKDVRDTNSILDSMRERGGISEEDADTLRTIMKQGWLGTTSLGAKILGSEELELGGEMVGLDQQKQILDNLLEDVDEFQSGRQDVTAKERQQEFFNWFSDGGRVGMKAGGMDRRTFLKWLAGIAATATGLIKGKGLTQKVPVAKAVPKAIAKFQGVEGMPAWFPRAVAKIKAHGKLISMADRQYVNGDIYEMMIPIKVPKFDRVAGKELPSGFETVNKKVVMEENPLSGEIELSWKVEDFDGEMTRQINFKPGEAGYQKFGVDPDYPQAWEYNRVKVSDPEFSYGNPDQSNPYREEFEYRDIFTQGDEIVDGLEKMTGGKNMVTKDANVVEDVAVTDYGKTKADKEIDEAFQKKIYKDIEGEAALQPDPEGQLGPEGDWLGDSPNEMIDGDVPDWVPKDKMWDPTKKAEGGIIETGNIARRPGAVPPLSGPSPDGIMSLYSNPKQVNVG